MMSELPATFVSGFHDEETVRKMDYNELGQTGLAVSKLSLGGGKSETFNYIAIDMLWVWLISIL